MLELPDNVKEGLLQVNNPGLLSVNGGGFKLCEMVIKAVSEHKLKASTATKAYRPGAVTESAFPLASTTPLLVQSVVAFGEPVTLPFSVKAGRLQFRALPD